MRFLAKYKLNYRYIIGLTICLWLSAWTDVVADASPLHVTMIPELRVADHRVRVADHRDGTDHYHYVPAKQVQQGQEIYYTVRIVNVTNEKIKHAVVVQPVPANTQLLDGSVTGIGAIITYSIDDGHTFIAASEAYDAANAHHAPHRITHIRWQFRHPLSPHVVVFARFRVVFD